MENTAGGGWDKTRHYQRHPNRWNNRSPTGYSLGTGPRSSHSDRSTPVDIAAFDLDKVVPRSRRVSCSACTACILQWISSIVVMVIFASPGWGRSREGAASDSDLKSDLFGIYGFWIVCFQEVINPDQRFCFGTATRGYEAGWWIAVQALGCAFLILSIIDLIIISIYVFRIKSNRKRSVSISHALCGVVTCLAMLACIILFAINFLDSSWWCCPNGQEITETILYWAWYLAIVALITQFISTCLTIAESVHLSR